ncbi:MAG TPA: PilZ domain-containing protein [Thermoleophilaceae bacterium]|nr:PilZ domain-containing protein [Thermoleophilaceae bacterium]
MRRLREHQFVRIEVERPSASIECLVLAVEGNEATLEPVVEQQLALLPPEGKDALLTFEYRSQLVMLRGTGRRGENSELRFAVTDRVTVPQRRRYARVDVALPITLTPSGGSGATVETRTRDLSADGMLVEELLPAAEQSWRVKLELPDGPPLEGEASLVRHVGGGTAMRYSEISQADRQRLRDFVAARKRELLADLRKQSD